MASYLIAQWLCVATLLSPPAWTVYQAPQQNARVQGFYTAYDPQLAPRDNNSYVLDTPVFAYRWSANAAALDGWSQALGLSLTNVDEPLRVHLGLTPTEGMLITGVTEDGAAARAKLQTHDVILGLPTTVQVDRPLNLVTVRAGQRLNLQLDAKPAKQFWIGVHTSDLEDAMRTQLSLPGGRGILITDVVEKSPAQQAGMLKHDVVTGLASGTAISTTDDFSKLVQGSKGKALQLQIVRHAKSITLGVTPIERPQEKRVETSTTEAVSKGLRWVELNRANPAWVTAGELLTQPTANLYPSALSRVLLQQPAGQDPASKVDALQQQVQQLLQEVTALRETLEKNTKEKASPTPKK